jgi:hypothetical protein
MLKVPRFLLVLVAETRLRKGKALGGEKVKFHDVDFVMSRGEKLSRGFTAYDRN